MEGVVSGFLTPPSGMGVSPRFRATGGRGPAGKGSGRFLAGKLHSATQSDISWSAGPFARSEEHTSELQSRENLVCRLLLEKKKAGTQPAPGGQTRKRGM